MCRIQCRFYNFFYAPVVLGLCFVLQNNRFDHRALILLVFLDQSRLLLLRTTWIQLEKDDRAELSALSLIYQFAAREHLSLMLFLILFIRQVK